MKVGVVTYFDICNYGSVLQAYAMKHTLSSFGDDAVFLRIREQKKLYKYLHMIYVGAVTAGKCLTNSQALKTHCEIRALRKKGESSISPECRKAFAEFVSDNLPSLTIDRISLKKRAAGKEFGAFICGSDQIWSPLSLTPSSFKYLAFAPPDKKIAYAPSFGVEEIPSYNKSRISRALDGFDDISVRETSGSSIIKDLTGKDVPVVLDPTMLITGDEWREIYRLHTGNIKEDNYILCYFFDEPENSILDRVSQFAGEQNMKIIVLSDANSGMILRGAEAVQADPWHFLSLIDHASYIFTNSFHGSVFSVLFSRKFIVFGRDHSDTVKQTSRITTLLETAGASECLYKNARTGFVFPDPGGFAEKLCEPRRASLDYLSGCLEKRRNI